jgi:hypothetical protein
MPELSINKDSPEARVETGMPGLESKAPVTHHRGGKEEDGKEQVG